jgi:hypothetical protein
MRLLLLIAVAALFSISTFAQNHNQNHAKNVANPDRHHATGGGNAIGGNAIAAGKRSQSNQEKELAELERRGSATHGKAAAPPKAAVKLPKEQAQRNQAIDFTYHPAKAQNGRAGNTHKHGYRK